MEIDTSRFDPERLGFVTATQQILDLSDEVPSHAAMFKSPEGSDVLVYSGEDELVITEDFKPFADEELRNRRLLTLSGYRGMTIYDTLFFGKQDRPDQWVAAGQHKFVNSLGSIDAFEFRGVGFEPIGDGSGWELARERLLKIGNLVRQAAVVRV